MRGLAVASIVGQLAWLILVVVAGLAEPGYSEARDAVSELGARTAERPWLFNAGVTVWGLSFVAAGVALGLAGPGGGRGWLGPGLIVLTGVAQILAGFPFPADCRTTIDVGCEARELAGEVSWRHEAHGWAYFLGAIALLLSVFAMAWRFRGDPRWGRADLLAVGAGAFGLLVFAGLFFAVDVQQSYGLFQRLALAAGGIWVAALTLGLLAVRSGRFPQLGFPHVREPG
ncbi:MAG TPA: DUF998 domain-containing protein [Solirubrobacterales bacterium]|nr:DUF998 domain-containing protein [Solirubrobacterales bacterium]